MNIYIFNPARQRMQEAHYVTTVSNDMHDAMHMACLVTYKTGEAWQSSAVVWWTSYIWVKQL